MPKRLLGVRKLVCKKCKVYEVLRSTLKIKVNNKETNIEKMITTRLGRKPELPYHIEEESITYCLMMKRNFFGLTTRSIKRMAFEPAIKMVLSTYFQYNKEEQAGSGCANLCAAIFD